jgi:hypothetical protein
MSIVVVEPAELRRLIGEAVESAVARASLADEWVDARTSPLPRRAFLKLAREGAFPASLVGNKFMARRRDVEAYLEQQRIRPEASRQARGAVPTCPIRPAPAVASNDDPVARALAAGRLRIVKTAE